MRMEEKNRSGSHSGGGGGVVKNRSSSGCLIIKKKPEEIGLVGCSSRENNNININKKKKEKKRARLTTPVGSDSVSSDEELLEFYRRRGGGRDNPVSACAPPPPPPPPLVYKRGVGNHGGEFSSKINDFDDVGFASKLDVYDFDEYDDLSDVERLGMMGYYGRDIGLGCSSESRFMSSRAVGIKTGLDFESASSKGGGDIIYRRRNSFNGSMSGEKIKGSGGDRRSVKRRFEVKNEVPGISIGKEKFGGSNEAIRLQGKNGVLKVMVKHKKENTSACLKPQSYVQVEGASLVPRSPEMSSKNVVIRSSPYSDRRLQKKPMVIGRVEKDQERKRKSVSAKSSEESDEESEDSDASPKLQSDSAEGHRPVKRGRSGGSMRSPEITPQPVKLKEGKVKRGSGTEKQKLREKIRNMLVSAGWTIDYRPRRGRDYFDAVYVNPAGTAYWSIIKAYDALQKQLEEEGNSLKLGGDECSLFSPISEDILSKLTRQTRKKIEKELKRKKREEGGGKRKKELPGRNFEDNDSDTDSTGSGRHDDKLSSFMKRSGKSFKGASKETYSRDGSSPNSRDRGEKSSSMSNSRFIHGRKSKKIGRCTLLIRSSKKGVDSDGDGFVPYTGKRNLLSWLIDSGTVKLSEKVHYMNRRRTRIMLEGWITRDGIHCGCCSKILSISKFEIHAASKLRQPFQNIYLSSGASLMQCQVDAWNRQDESQHKGFCEVDVDGNDPNDDTCAICGDGGDLICCDGCPSTFHQNCLNIRMLPPGDWHCPHCSCKFCGLADVSIGGGNDSAKAIILTCSLCEGKYHSSCLEEKLDTPVNSNDAASFCGKRCQELFEQLQKLLGVRHELEAGLCWSLIHRTDLDSDINGRGYPLRVEWNSKLAVALTVMDECFLPIIDRRSGINMIHNVLYNCGSNFTRLNYSGFYTAILERGDEIVSAASIRIRGTQFAEMPFIGTRHIYRRQGMCRRLFSAIESALRSLKVEKLIIPAISELMDTWTGVFGFSALGDNDKQEMKTLNILAFPGTDMLQKKLIDEDNTKTDFAGVNSLEVGYNNFLVPELTNKDDHDGSSGPSSVDAVPEKHGTNDKSDMDLYCQDAVASVEETSLHSAPGGCIETKSSLDSACVVISNEVKPPVSSEVGQGTTSTNSAFQVDTKLSEAVGDVKVHDSSAKHDKAPVDCKLMEETSNANAGTGMPPADISGDGTTDSLLNGSLENDDHALTGQTLCSKSGSAATREHHSLVGTSHDDVVVAKTMIASPAKGNIQDPMAIDVDATHEVPAKITKVCSSPPTTELLTTPVDGMCISPENVSHGAVEQSMPQLVSCNEDSNEQNLEALHTHKVTVGIDQQHDSCDAGSSQGILEGQGHELHGIGVKVAGVQSVSNDGFEVSAQNVGTIKLEESQLDSCGGGGNQPNLESEIHHACDSSEVACVPQTGNFPCEVPGHSDGAVGIKKCLHDSCEDSNQPIPEGKVHEISDDGVNDQPVCEISCQSNVDVGIKKLQHDSCEGSDQPISEDKVHDISVEGSNDQLISKFEVSTHTDTSETPPSLSTDGGTGETVSFASDES